MATQRPQRIVLTETDSELLLTIPAHQKERAKRMEGRRWDAVRVCWVYPREPSTYDAIIAEFGDELKDTVIRRPDRPEPPASVPGAASELAGENDSLRQELADVRKTIELLAEAGRGQADSEVARLRAALAEREAQIEALRRRLDEQEITAKGLAEAVSALESENSRLRVDLGAATGNAQADGKVLGQLLKWAVQGSAGSEQFLAELRRIKTLDRYPLELATALERTLRQRLGCDDDMRLYDLIVLADDSGVLTQQAVDLAHVIRRQRNIADHSVGKESVDRARACLCLFASCLLWRELPEPAGAAGRGV